MFLEDVGEFFKANSTPLLFKDDLDVLDGPDEMVVYVLGTDSDNFNEDDVRYLIEAIQQLQDRYPENHI